MNTLRSVVLVLLLAALTGCDPVNGYRDINPPAAPRNLTTEAGNGFVELFWNGNREADLAGYNIFVSSSYNGRYELIGSTSVAGFVDHGAQNGETYYYAVTAFDYDGNESELSLEEAYDIPRPDGFNLVMIEYRRAPRTAAFDFSAFSVVPYADASADMFYVYEDAVPSMAVPEDTDIQDMGPTSSIYEIRVAPASGWSPSRAVDLRVGHTYVVWTWDDHFAKFRVSALSSTRVVFDWAYQLQRSNPLMKRGARAGALRSAGPVLNED